MPILRPRWGDVSISLLAGVMVTVLVSWSLALNGGARRQPQAAGVTLPWPVRVDAGWPAAPRSATRFAAGWWPGGLEQWAASGTYSFYDARNDDRLFVSRAGWPMLAMESVLCAERRGGYVSRDSIFAAGSSIEGGIAVPLHWTRPHEQNAACWSAQRLPLRPMPIGFAVNTALAAGGAMVMIQLWRWRVAGLVAAGRRWPRLRLAAVILFLGFALNVVVTAALWCRWQFDAAPLGLWGGWSAGYGDYARLPEGAAWPVAVPGQWPPSPTAMGWLGDMAGVRGYQLTSIGVPRAALWTDLGANWVHDAYDPHASMHILSVGWPMAWLQSEELIEVVGRSKLERGPPKEDDPPWSSRPFGPVERRGALLNMTLPGAPTPKFDSEPQPLIPARPLPLGLLVNMLVFTTPAALLVLVPGAVRAWRRRRGGRCQACGYEVRDLATCPECGLAQTKTEMPGQR